MLKEFSLEGRTALITGAGRGIVRAIASTLAEAGADIVAASRTPAELDETAMEVHKQGRKCIPIAPHMIEKGKGKIVNIVSTAAIKYTALQGIYPATKAAIVPITRGLANELARFNITVNAIGPGGVLTAMLEKIYTNEEISKTYLRSVPLRRFGEPREVALLTLYLASDASNYMTGQTLYLDGGYTIS